MEKTSEKSKGEKAKEALRKTREKSSGFRKEFIEFINLYFFGFLLRLWHPSCD